MEKLETPVPGSGDSSEELKIKKIFCLFACSIENRSIRFSALLLLQCGICVTAAHT